MPIPIASHPAWKALVVGKRDPELEFLGLRILVGRARVIAKHSATPAKLEAFAHEIHDLVVRNARHPKIQRDLTRILQNSRH